MAWRGFPFRRGLNRAERNVPVLFTQIVDVVTRLVEMRAQGSQMTRNALPANAFQSTSEWPEWS